MQKIIFLIASIAIVAAVGIGMLASQSGVQTYQGNDLQSEMYIPSDMSKAFPDYTLTVSHLSMTTTDITKVKDEVKYTVVGTVIKISESVVWIDPTPHDASVADSLGDRIKIDVDIQVDVVTKGNDIKKGDVLTITITGTLHDNNLITLDSAEQFELDEQVIVHVSEDPNDIIGKNIHYVKLGEFGKYKIQGDKAFNSKNPSGKSIKEALEETK